MIELTKQLEREPCDSISFTHRMAKAILPEAMYVEPTEIGSATYIVTSLRNILSLEGKDLPTSEIYGNLAFRVTIERTGSERISTKSQRDFMRDSALHLI